MLKAKKVYLRELEAGDVSEEYVRWLNDPDVNQYLETRFAEQTMASVLEFVKDKKNGDSEHLFGIFLNGDDTHIGNIKIGPVNTYHSFAPVSLFIGDKSTWGKGFGTEAIGLAVDFGFEQLGLEKLEAGCYEENVGSKRAFEKCGFVVEGVLRKQRKVEGGRTSDIVLGILREEWKG